MMRAATLATLVLCVSAGRPFLPGVATPTDLPAAEPEPAMQPLDASTAFLPGALSPKLPQAFSNLRDAFTKIGASKLDPRASCKAQLKNLEAGCKAREDAVEASYSKGEITKAVRDEQVAGIKKGCAKAEAGLKARCSKKPADDAEAKEAARPLPTLSQAQAECMLEAESITVECHNKLSELQGANLSGEVTAAEYESQKDALQAACKEKVEAKKMSCEKVGLTEGVPPAKRCEMAKKEIEEGCKKMCAEIDELLKDGKITQEVHDAKIKYMKEACHKKLAELEKRCGKPESA